MTNLITEADSILAIDIGSVNTRALLFDVADGQYRFIAAGAAPSTEEAPFKDTGEGVRLAIDRLQAITGRSFIGADERLIIPSRADGAGVDQMVVTSSAGPEVNLVVIGLLSDVSLESARRLAASTYGRVVETIGLGDRRKQEVQIDAIIQASPDIVILAGGTEGGASRSVMKLVEPLGLACYLIPQNRRPAVLFAGNKDLEEKVKTALEGIATVWSAPNIRPAFDVEDLSPAQESLAEMVEQVRARQVGGIQNMVSLSGGNFMLNANAFGRIIRFHSMVNDPNKGVLGIDLGASSTVMASAYRGRLNLKVHRLGMGESLVNLLASTNLSEITQWLPFPISDAAVLDYLHHKSVYPSSLPASTEELAIEQAAARQIIRQVVRALAPPSSIGLVGGGAGQPIPYEPVLAAGSVIARAPTPGQSLLILLDGIQPVGVTTFVMDPNGLSASLGAAADSSPLLPVQVIESGAFSYLGTVVSPISEAHFGDAVLKARLVREDGSETSAEVTQGSLVTLSIPRGTSGQLFLEPYGKVNLALSKPGKGVKIVGGALGVVIDARGRPIALPTDEAKRRELVKKWTWTVGG